MKFENNFLTSENGAKVIKYSSSMEGCEAENVLNSDNKTIWLSEEGLPQYLVIDLTSLKNKPEDLKCFGIYCWHAYPTNPKLLELSCSKDNINFDSLGNFDIQQKPGVQLFNIEWEIIDIQMLRFLKINIKESHGGGRTYLNNIFLFEDFPEGDSLIVIDSRERNMPRQSETFTERRVKEIKDIKAPKEIKGIDLKLGNFINAINPLAISDIRTNISANRELNSKNVLLTSDTRYLMSDSELSLRNDKVNSSLLSTTKNKNEIREAISDEEEKEEEDITTSEYKTHIQKPSYTTNTSALEDKLMKGLEHKYVHNKKKLSHLENYKNKIKRLNDENEKSGLSSRRNDSNNSIVINQKQNIKPMGNNLKSNYNINSSNEDIFNYHSLEGQIREMQSQLNRLNYNTERINSFREQINKSKEDEELIEQNQNLKNKISLSSLNVMTPCNQPYNTNLTEKNIYVDNLDHVDNLAQYNFVSPPISPTNRNVAGGSNTQREVNNTLDNYINSPETESRLDTKLNNLETEVGNLKSQISKLSDNIETLISTKNMLNANNMQFILDQCKTMIHKERLSSKDLTGDNNLHTLISNFNSTKSHHQRSNSQFNTNENTFKTRFQQNSQLNNLGRTNSNVYDYSAQENLPNEGIYNYNTIHNNKDIQQLYSQENEAAAEKERRKRYEKLINKKIDEKFESLAQRLEQKIYRCLLKPTVEKLENSLKGNLNEIKIHLKNIKNRDEERKDNTYAVTNNQKGEYTKKIKDNRKDNAKNKKTQDKKRNYNLSINTFESLDSVGDQL